MLKKTVEIATLAGFEPCYISGADMVKMDKMVRLAMLDGYDLCMGQQPSQMAAVRDEFAAAIEK